MQRVDTTLSLGSGSAALEADGTGTHATLHGLNRVNTNILERVLETSVEVGDELLDRALVNNRSRDTLGDLDRVRLGVVTLGRTVSAVAGLLHSIQGPHTAVLLEALAIEVEILTGGLGGSSKETTHHDGRSTKGQSLGDVANVTDTTISNNGDTVLGGELGNLVNGSTLGTTAGHDLLGDADRARAHTNTETIGTGSDQASSLLPDNNVSGNDLEIGEGGLDPLDHVDLEGRVTLGRIQDNNVQTSSDQESETIAVIGTGSDGGTAEQLLRLGGLGGQGVVLVLEQVRAGQEGAELALGVDDGELALLRLAQDLVGLLKGDTLLGNDEIGGHAGLKGESVVVDELDVTGSDNTDELGTELAVLCFRSDWSFKENGLVNRSFDLFIMRVLELANKSNC